MFPVKSTFSATCRSSHLQMFYKISVLNPLSASPRKWSNTLNRFVGVPTSCLLECLTILWGWHLKGYKFCKILPVPLFEQSYWVEAQVFSFEFPQIFKSAIFTEHLRGIILYKLYREKDLKPYLYFN